MSNYSKNSINQSPGSVSRLILNGVPIVPTSSVFHSPDKNSMVELKFRAIQAQQARRNLNVLSPNEQARYSPAPMSHNGGLTLAMPPPGLIPESLVRDILSLIKKEYPWAEALLASKMSQEQFKLLMDKLPELKNIITSRMPVVPPSVGMSVAPSVIPLPQQQFQQHHPHSPMAGMGAPHFLQEMATAAVAAAEKVQQEREKNQETDGKRRQRATMNFIELLLQIKKCAEIGLVDEEILNEPLSPMTMSMINSMVLHVKKLAEVRRANFEGKSHNPDDELAIRKRLLEMREYIREEQKIYIESLKRRPEEEHETVEQLLKRL